MRSGDQKLSAIAQQEQNKNIKPNAKNISSKII